MFLTRRFYQSFVYRGRLRCSKVLSFDIQRNFVMASVRKRDTAPSENSKNPNPEDIQQQQETSNTKNWLQSLNSNPIYRGDSGLRITNEYNEHPLPDLSVLEDIFKDDDDVISYLKMVSDLISNCYFISKKRLGASQRTSG